MIKTILLLTFFLSCKQEYNQEKCETLSLKSFKGVPTAAHKFNKNCSSFKIQYSKENCQQAFNQLALKGHTKGLKKKYGTRILECFSKSDRRKFLSPTEK